MSPELSDSSKKRHPIQVVARRTGLTVDVLRAWEKRYSVVEPGRSEGGRRLYSDDDIERLRLLRRASKAGRRISQVSSLGTDELATLVREDEREEVESGPEEALGEATAAELYLKTCLAAMERMDAEELEDVLNRALLTLNSQNFIDGLAAPLMRKVGDAWSQGDVRPAHEHVASTVLQRVMARLLDGLQPVTGAPNIVVGTPAGEGHEFGALFVAATAGALGWRVTYLGPNLPAEDIAIAVRDTGADIVALSIVYPTEDTELLEEELKELRLALPPAVPVLVGGAGMASCKEALDEIEAIQLNDMEELSRALADLA
jgi:DNA-binding transcriptional MerR regulator/methylmalonyl-CoA mutase cobalamin-binding subunit